MSYSSPIPYIIETLQEIKRLLSGQQELRTGNDNGNNNGNDDKKREREEELEGSNKKMKKK